MGSRGFPGPGRPDHVDDAPAGGPLDRLRILRTAFVDEANGEGDSEVLARLDRAISKLETELALTPMARARMGIGRDAEPADEVAEWLSGIETR